MGNLRKWSDTAPAKIETALAKHDDLLANIVGPSRMPQQIEGLGTLFLLATNAPEKAPQIAKALAKHLDEPGVIVRGFAQPNQIQVIVPPGNEQQLTTVGRKIRDVVMKNRSEGLGTLTVEQMEGFRYLSDATVRPFNGKDIVELAVDDGIRANQRDQMPTLVSGVLGPVVKSIAYDGNKMLVFLNDGVNAQELADKINGVRTQIAAKETKALPGA